MRITESQLRRQIRKVLKEQYQSFDLRRGVPRSETIPPEDIPIIKTISDNAAGRDITLEVTPKSWQITMFRRGELVVSLEHDLVNDKWMGNGPSEAETESLGERNIGDRSDAMDFAKNFGSEGPIDRGMSAISDFFSF